ncbi:hypothetical protein Q9R08_15945 [Microbacterium sp. QXD-8]|uniref:DUF3563 domain-containing protein n=1 Tax=Microbacterium psychrotolerans TaxID=3068321 RepID=A0ABU0Z4H1_9MICO|nr:hypothetical protein [Microbacterium sp. QXD-8]MDQ7879485.1 hypothetical protein [Microbacterium sp. QXD-8]
MSEKPSRWIRLKWAILGKPVTYEEHRNAQASHYYDARVSAQLELRNQRFEAGQF